MVRAARYVIIAALAAVWLAIGCPETFSALPYWERALSYSFLHTSVWHLAANALALWVLLDHRCKGLLRNIAVAYVIAVLVYGLALRPIVGISNMIYAYCGLGTPPLSSPWWRKREVVIFLVVTVALLLIPQVSAFTHIVSFLAGMLVASSRRGLQSLVRDAERFVK